MTNKKDIRVRFNEFGDSSLNILVYFYLEVRDIAAELKEREDILFQIMEIAQKLGVEFAFPTRTLHVAAATAPVAFEERSRPGAMNRIASLTRCALPRAAVLPTRRPASNTGGGG